jgi:hypothetical protein
VAKIMKAKYFLGGSILDVRVGNRPSFAWKSIISSCNILKEGLVWRVGNGSQIRIWKDRWIPQPTTYRVRSSPQLLDLDATANMLINKDTKWWDLSMLESNFNKEEIQLIQSIPISYTNRKDVLIWKGTTNGLFSV